VFLKYRNTFEKKDTSGFIALFHLRGWIASLRQTIV